MKNDPNESNDTRCIVCQCGIEGECHRLVESFTELIEHRWAYHPWTKKWGMRDSSNSGDEELLICPKCLKNIKSKKEKKDEK